MSQRPKRKERRAIIQSLRAGVVPNIGLHYIQVGRKAEIAALLDDLEIAKDGGASVRFVIGRFGSGKTFLLNLTSNVAHEQGFLVARADITMERRLYGGGGQARGLYTELVRNLSIKTQPTGGAIRAVLERFLSSELAAVSEDPGELAARIKSRLAPLMDMVFGFDFTAVLLKYLDGFVNNNDELQSAAIQWLRGEYTTKTEARIALGVRNIIDDETYYDAIKLWASFARIAGYSGLMIAVDELVVLSHRLPNSKARNANYETILKILNDCLQGNVEGLMVLFGGTDECLEDRRRGIYSYEALATRLAPNEFESAERQVLSGPVMRLSSLTPEDLYALLHRIREVFFPEEEGTQPLPNEGLVAFMEYSKRNLGAEYFRTPRDVVTRFVGLLSLLESDASTDWRELLETAVSSAVPQSTSAETGALLDSGNLDDSLVTFRL